MKLNPLLLAGGRSSRMGTRKELLCVTHIPLYEHQLVRLHMATDSEADSVYLSLPDPSYLPPILENPRIEQTSHGPATLRLHRQSPKGDSFLIQVLYDSGRVSSASTSAGANTDDPVSDPTSLRSPVSDSQNDNARDRPDSQPDNTPFPADAGPASGLLAALAHDPNASWLVAACDYPFLSLDALKQLREAQEHGRGRERAGSEVQSGSQPDSVTCFENKDGIFEPLIGIWTPRALSMLGENVHNGILGPKAVVFKAKGTTLRPRDGNWLFNMNTPDDYDEARRMKEYIGIIMNDYYGL